MAGYAGGSAASHDLGVILGQARAQIEVTKRHQNPRQSTTDPATGCWIATSGIRGRDGYGTCKPYTNATLAAKRANPALDIRNMGVNLLLHRVALFSRTGINPVNTGSHLCNRKACFNPAHIVDEDQATNLARKYCTPSLYCDLHSNVFHPGSCTSSTPHTHTPPCIALIRVPACCNLPPPPPPVFMPPPPPPTTTMGTFAPGSSLFSSSDPPIPPSSPPVSFAPPPSSQDVARAIYAQLPSNTPGLADAALVIDLDLLDDDDDDTDEQDDLTTDAATESEFDADRVFTDPNDASSDQDYDPEM